MLVQEIMTKEVFTLGPGASLADAARLMWEHDFGFLPIVDANNAVPLGVLTDRDTCMAALMQGAPLHQLLVENAMSKMVLSCQPQDDVRRAHEIMRRHQIHRLPVVNGEGRVIGVVSVKDLARIATSQRGGGRQQQCAEVGETIAEICRPRALSATA